MFIRGMFRQPVFAPENEGGAAAPEGGEGFDARAERVLGLLGGDDDGAPEPDAAINESQPQEGEDAAPQDEASGEDEGQREPDSPAIEAPLSWSAEGKAAFAKLPPELQQIVAQRESERERGVSQRMNEAAEKAKAAEAAQAEAAQERQRYAQSLDQFVNLAQMIDPVLAEGQRTDWAKLARENPAEYVQKWAEYQQRFGQVQAAMAQRDHLATQQRSEHMAREERALLAKIPEWADPAKGKAGIDEIRRAAVERYGFKPEEVQVIGDHRYALILRDALAFHKLEAAKKTAVEKKVSAPVKVQKPGNGADKSGADARLAALRNRANRSGRLEDRAEYVLAKLGTE